MNIDGSSLIMIAICVFLIQCSLITLVFKITQKLGFEPEDTVCMIYSATHKVSHFTGNSVSSILSYMFTSVTHIGYSNVADNLCWIRSSFVAINSTTLLPSNSNSSWWSFGPTSQSMDGSSETTYFNSISINDSYIL